MSRSLLTRIGPPVLTLAGALFTAYPALRPYRDETTLAGAAGMASGFWVAAHVLGILAFGLLSLALASLALGSRGQRSMITAAVLGWFGTVLVLPYYGAETFGLQAIAARAVADQDPSLLALTDAVRYAPAPMIMFGTGLVLLAATGACLVVATWHTGARLGGLALGLGLVLYLPQFFGPPALRISHGVLLLLGCLLVARSTRLSAGDQ